MTLALTSTAEIYLALDCNRLDANFGTYSSGEKEHFEREVLDITSDTIKIALTKLDSLNNSLKTIEDCLADIRVNLDKVKNESIKHTVEKEVKTKQLESATQRSALETQEKELNDLIRKKNSINPKMKSADQTQMMSTIRKEVGKIQEKQKVMGASLESLKTDAKRIVTMIQPYIDTTSGKRLAETFQEPSSYRFGTP